MGDVTQSDVTGAMIYAAVSAFGRLDILVNNVFEGGEVPFEELTLTRFHQVLASPFDSALLCTRGALPYLKKSDMTTIANIGSEGSHAGEPESTHVAVAKAALFGMAGSVAPEEVPRRITLDTLILALAKRLAPTVQCRRVTPRAQSHRPSRRDRGSRVCGMVTERARRTLRQWSESPHQRCLAVQHIILD